MKNLFIFKAETNNVTFDSGDVAGLFFVESAVDIRFLNNVVIDQRLKIQVEQKVTVLEEEANKVSPLKATVWFIVLSEKPYTNTSLEEELAFAKNIANQLHKITKLGFSFAYRNIYSAPNISDDWNTPDICIGLNQNGDFKEIYCVDRTTEVKIQGGDSEYKAELKHIRPDFVFCIGSDEQQSQAQYVHIALPSQDIQIDSSPLRTSDDLSLLKDLYDATLYRSSAGIIFELYHEAITSKNLFTSFLTLFQIAETIVKIPEPTRLSAELIGEIVDRLPNKEFIDNRFKQRLSSSLSHIEMETSKELLLDGLVELLDRQAASKLDIKDFGGWRTFRGKITHSKRSQDLIDSKFVKQYKSIRKFADELIDALETKLYTN